MFDSQKSTIGDSYQKMVVEILHTANWLDVRICEVLSESGITHPQFNVLRILEGASPEPISVGCIKEKILFSKSDITRLIDRLVDKKLVQRVVCPDNRRKMDVTITNTGLQTIVEILPKLEVKLKSYYRNVVSAEKKDTLIDIMHLLRCE